MLCWGLVEQARHEHMSGEYKNRYYTIIAPLSPTSVKVRDTTVGSERVKTRGEG